VNVADGKVFANSRDVAEFFGKRHDHVLRHIDSLVSKSPNLGALGFFREASYADAKGEDRRAFDMTRDGFTLLAMGFTCAKAAFGGLLPCCFGHAGVRCQTTFGPTWPVPQGGHWLASRQIWR
jgi:Rha family phage regulatory protein